jgi:hypothetical protein
MLCCISATPLNGRPGAPKLQTTPIPPFFDKHALKNLKVSLRVTITCKNVIKGLQGEKFLKNAKHF